MVLRKVDAFGNERELILGESDLQTLAAAVGFLRQMAKRKKDPEVLLSDDPEVEAGIEDFLTRAPDYEPGLTSPIDEGAGRPRWDQGGQGHP